MAGPRPPTPLGFGSSYWWSLTTLVVRDGRRFTVFRPARLRISTSERPWRVATADRETRKDVGKERRQGTRTTRPNSGTAWQRIPAPRTSVRRTFVRESLSEARSGAAPSAIFHRHRAAARNRESTYRSRMPEGDPRAWHEPCPS